MTAAERKTRRDRVIDAVCALTGERPAGVAGIHQSGASVAREPRGIVRLSPWVYGTEREATAALVEAGLLPESWVDPDRAPGWWCRYCRGTGVVTSPGFDPETGPCGCRGPSRGAEFAPDFRSLITVASIGKTSLALAASLVDEASRGSSILWRVMCRYDLHSHHGSIWREKGAILDEASPEMVFSGEVNAARDGHALEPFASLASDYGPSHRTAPWWRPMPALLSLGAELVQTGDGYAVLAVEELAAGRK